MDVRCLGEMANVGVTTNLNNLQVRTLNGRSVTYEVAIQSLTNEILDFKEGKEFIDKLDKKLDEETTIKKLKEKILNTNFLGFIDSVNIDFGNRKNKSIIQLETELHLHPKEAIDSIVLDSRKMTRIPTEIGLFTELMQISVMAGNICEIPHSIKNLTNLFSLIMHYNKLKVLPPEIGELKNLKILDLTGNQLKSLPNESVGLVSLEKLYLGNNLFEIFPTIVIKMSSLQKLDLTNNKIKEIPHEFQDFKDLNKLQFKM